MTERGGTTSAIPATLGRLDKRSLSTRTREAILDSIRGGLFEDGRLPPEPALAKRLGVSRSTLRAALRSLEDQGVLQRQPGVGTIINEHVMRSTISLNRVVGFSRLIHESGYEAAVAWTNRFTRPAPTEIAIRLGCALGEELVCFEKLLLADGEPAIYLIEQVPGATLVEEPAPESLSDSIFDLMAAFGPESVDHTILELGCVIAEAKIAEILTVPESSPVLHLQEIHYGISGRALLFSDIYVNQTLVRLGVVRTHG